jgi:hypothetical protein
VSEDTRIIKLPSRTASQTAVDVTRRPEQYKDLVAQAQNLDAELATIVSMWPRLSRSLKDALLDIAASGK